MLSGGFTCPRCLALVAELPSSCHVCGLTLVSSPHLARSYHHLFPIKPFVEVAAEALTQAMVGFLILSMPPHGAPCQILVPVPMSADLTLVSRPHLHGYFQHLFIYPNVQQDRQAQTA